jgi:hypothetical protein
MVSHDDRPGSGNFSGDFWDNLRRIFLGLTMKKYYTLTYTRKIGGCGYATSIEKIDNRAVAMATAKKAKRMGFIRIKLVEINEENNERKWNFT